MRIHLPLRAVVPSLVGSILGLSAEAQAAPIQIYTNCTVQSVQLYGTTAPRVSVSATCGLTQKTFAGYAVLPDPSCASFLGGTPDVVLGWGSMAQAALINGKHLEVAAWVGPGACLDAVYWVKLTQ